MKEIDRNQLQSLLASGAQVLEVLPSPEYEQIHIKGAKSLPLKEMNAKSVANLDRSRPIVTYCYDFQ